jgi:hypothetical protein
MAGSETELEVVDFCRSLLRTKHTKLSFMGSILFTLINFFNGRPSFEEDLGANVSIEKNKMAYFDRD